MKNPQKTLFLAVVIIVISGTVYTYFSKEKITAQPSQQITQKDFISAGDKLGGMTVVSVSPFNSGQYSSDPEVMKIGPHNVKLKLQGQIEVTGTYGYINSEMGFSGYCMSKFDTAALSLLPHLSEGNKESQIFFCFRNEDFVKNKLGEKERIVRVKIDNYELNSYPAEVTDWADLIEVVKE